MTRVFGPDWAQGEARWSGVPSGAGVQSGRGPVGSRPGITSGVPAEKEKFRDAIETYAKYFFLYGIKLCVHFLRSTCVIEKDAGLKQWNGIRYKIYL